MTVEEFFSKDGALLAIVISSNYNDMKGRVFSPPDDAIQAGVLFRKKGYTVRAHSHPYSRPAAQTDRHEVMHIIDGAMRMDLYSRDDEKQEPRKEKEIELKTGDTILVFCAHGTYFEEDTKFLEIKQGPYPGAERDKIWIETDGTPKIGEIGKK